MCTVKWSSVGKVAQVHSSTETESSPLHQSSPASRICLIWPIIGWTHSSPPVQYSHEEICSRKTFSVYHKKKYNPQEQYDISLKGSRRKRVSAEWVNGFLFSNLLLAWGMTRGALWLSLITIRQPRHRSSGIYLNQVGTKASIKWHKGLRCCVIWKLSGRINIEFCAAN